MRAQLEAALLSGRFNEAALLMRNAKEPADIETALASATPYRNKADIVDAFAELKARAKSGKTRSK